MCGLVGVAGNLYKPHIDAFTDLLFCDTLRGSDSTGVASFDSKGDGLYIKQVGGAYDLIDRRGYNDVVTINRRVIIGHNRSMTVGGKNRNNAHPFIFERIAGAHNGTLDHLAKVKMKDYNNFGTDSEAMFNNMEHEGIAETIEKLEGAWALTILDRDAMTMNFIRNDKRPLHYVFDKKREVLFWSSEVGLLMWILARRGIEVDKYYQLPTDMLYTWKIPTGANQWGEAETREVKGFQRAENFQQQGPFEGWSPHKQPSGGLGHPPSISPAVNSGSGKDSTANSDGVKTASESKAILAALERECPQGVGSWWNIIALEFEIGDKDAWHWCHGESSKEWLLRCMGMLRNGWCWGDPDASIILMPPSKKKDLVPTHVKAYGPEKIGPGSNETPKPIFNEHLDKVWNPVERRFQPLPFKGAECFWSEQNALWVFNPDRVDKLVENKAAYWDLTGQGMDWVRILDDSIKEGDLKKKQDDAAASYAKEWQQAIDDFDRYQELKNKKRLSKVDREWMAYYESSDYDREHPPFETETTVVKLSDYKYKNPVTKEEITKSEFEDLTKHGCDWCTKGISWGDKCTFHHTSGEIEVFCEECSHGSTEVQQYLRMK